MPAFIRYIYSINVQALYFLSIYFLLAFNVLHAIIQSFFPLTKSHFFASSYQLKSGRNRIAVPTHGDKSREPSTEAPFMAISRGCNSIAPVVPQYDLIASLMSVQTNDGHPLTNVPTSIYYGR